MSAARGAPASSSRLRFKLWLKLAIFGAFGVAATHAVHLVIGRDVASRAVAHEQAARGMDIARLVSRQAASAVLTDDRITLQEMVEHAAAGEHVAWCFIERDGVVLASSLGDQTPVELVHLRRDGRGGGSPLVVLSGARRYLDVVAPILDGAAGQVRVGIDKQLLLQARHDLGVLLGLVALGTIGLGIIAAFVIGRSIASPVKELLAVADRFDPASGSKAVPVRGTDELAELTERFNLMMARLHATHDEYQLSLRKSASSERLVALGSLVAGVAHEVNNPLAGLKNVHAALRRGELPPDKQREYLELMGDSLGRIEEIVSRLLDFGRPRPLAARAHSPTQLMRDAARMVGPALRQRGVRLVERVDDGAEQPVKADRLQVGQALLNLILNGLYVTPEGGELRLHVRHRPGFVGVSVEDDGPGIPPELRDRVLDPFFSTKPEGEGTGLGLSVTRTIVDAHGGELTFDFPPAGGTAVTVWLPLATQP